MPLDGEGRWNGVGGSRMPIDWRTGGVLVMKGEIQVSSTVWVEERRL